MPQHDVQQHCLASIPQQTVSAGSRLLHHTPGTVAGGVEQCWQEVKCVVDPWGSRLQVCQGGMLNVQQQQAHLQPDCPL